MHIIFLLIKDRTLLHFFRKINSEKKIKMVLRGSLHKDIHTNRSRLLEEEFYKV